ncbi:hypothetical protein Patl_2906 [Paraglaciecola sp. T6c]|nr:hypothetical protein Patl_2906 [Paraglaciecola sp. T6c]
MRAAGGVSPVTLTRELIMKCRILCAAILPLLASSNATAHAGQLNIKALDACELKERSQACDYRGTHNDLYIGTCQYMSDALSCVRNQPIQRTETPVKKDTQFNLEENRTLEKQ